MKQRIWRILPAALVIVLTLVANAVAQDHSGHGKMPPPAEPPLLPAAGTASNKEEPRIAVVVPAVQQTRIGLKTAVAVTEAVAHTIRTVGVVAIDEGRQAHVHTRVNGWIDDIYVAKVGERVKKNQPLVALYSPELLASAQELLAADAAGASGKRVAAAAVERLSLWGIAAEDIAAIRKSGKSPRALTIRAPVDGFVVTKNALLGMYVVPDMEMYEIVDLTHIWIIARLYEYDLAVVQAGDTVRVTLPYDNQDVVQGKIDYICPEVDPATRTGKARIVIDNAALKFRPGMYANVELAKNLGLALVVPDGAVLDTGLRRLVFVRTDGDRFAPRQVEVGPRVAGRYTILAGLQAGEEVVTSALFLIDTESKLQAVVQGGGAGPAGHGEHGK